MNIATRISLILISSTLLCYGYGEAAERGSALHEARDGQKEQSAKNQREQIKKVPGSRKLFAVDMPLFPLWETVSIDRIMNGAISAGPAVHPWSEVSSFGGWPVPRLNFSTDNTFFRTEGGVMKNAGGGHERNAGQINMAFDGSVWYALLGVDALFSQEKVSSAISGINFNADFRRRSYGGKGWVGIKIGSFADDYIAVRYAQGWIGTEGDSQFVVPDVDGIEWQPLYLEEFQTRAVILDGQVRLSRLSQNVRAEKVVYKRVKRSTDPLVFGENYLGDFTVRSETELIPLKKHDLIRMVLAGTKDFGGNNKLLFQNDYSAVRILLRIAFK
ncbi:MAG: hypothetical protein HYT67_01625 [Candidatus Yanofskybacteria bacterium]|nr:hypothetical protein [Candidatus Yanofskybacteria bacterium]